MLNGTIHLVCFGAHEHQGRPHTPSEHVERTRLPPDPGKEATLYRHCCQTRSLQSDLYSREVTISINTNVPRANAQHGSSRPGRKMTSTHHHKRVIVSNIPHTDTMNSRLRLLRPASATTLGLVWPSFGRFCAWSSMTTGYMIDSSGVAETAGVLNIRQPNPEFWTVAMPFTTASAGRQRLFGLRSLRDKLCRMNSSIA